MTPEYCTRRQIGLIYGDLIDPMNPLNQPTKHDSDIRNEQVSGSNPLVGSLELP
jgi:hypothetical protein